MTIWVRQVGVLILGNKYGLGRCGGGDYEIAPSASGETACASMMLAFAL